MLKNLLLSVLLVFTSTSAYRHGQTYGSTYQPQEVQYRGIGYGSQRSYDQIYSGTYRPFSGAEPMRVDGTWTQPSYGRSSRPGGGIRKVRGYDSSGNEVGDDSPEHGYWGTTFWEDGYEYFWDESEGCWYRIGSDGIYHRWESTLIGWHWSIFDGHNPTGTLTPGYKEPPVPVGSPLTMAVPAVIYAIIEYHRRRRSKEEFA